MKPNTKEGALSAPETDMVFDMGKLRTALHQLTDPRDPRGVRYALVDVLTLLILAKLGGAIW
jgi:hypothetical protein